MLIPLRLTPVKRAQGVTNASSQKSVMSCAAYKMMRSRSLACVLAQVPRDSLANA